MQTLQEIRSELIRLKWHVTAERFQNALRRQARAVKGGFNPDQPRVSAGNANGGQWTSGGASGTAAPFGGVFVDGEGIVHIDFGDFSEIDEFDEFNDFEDFDSTDFSDAKRRPPLPPIENPAGIPSARPDNVQHINQVAREVARNPYLTAYYFVTMAESVGYWLNEKHAEIKASQDPPRSLEELHNAVSQPGRGYDIHHIVEQTAARDQDFSEVLINGRDNKVRIPRYKHEEINSWFQTRNDAFDGMPPRRYLQGKSWDEHREIGLKALRDVGVLKP